MSFSNSPMFCLSTGRTDVVFGSSESSLPCKLFLFCGKCSEQNRINYSMGTLRLDYIQTGLLVKFTISYPCSRDP